LECPGNVDADEILRLGAIVIIAVIIVGEKRTILRYRLFIILSFEGGIILDGGVRNANRSLGAPNSSPPLLFVCFFDLLLVTIASLR
jgi:hypothetical protein